MLKNDLKVAIIRAGKTNVQVAREVGISAQYISEIIAGRRIPSLLIAFKIAESVNKKIDEVFWMEAPGE